MVANAAANYEYYDCSFCRKKGVAGRLLGLRRMEWCLALVVQLVYDTSGAPGGGGDGDPLVKAWTFEF